MPASSIEAVLDEHTDTLMAIPGVIGVGQGMCDDQPCIRVFAAQRTTEIEEQIPNQLDGYPVEVEVTGPIETQPRN